ncbi:MAG: hypothetical protein NTU41_04850 [Chloroflexi bacterium]|nr:hypothetical protein [Chloroflexota bacterium]
MSPTRSSAALPSVPGEARRPPTSPAARGPSLESKFLSAVTGRDIDEEGLSAIAARVFNLGRAVLVREGHRGAQDDRLPEAWHTVPLRIDVTNVEMLVPGKGGQAFTRKGAVVDRAEFATLMREYYQLRHWDTATGLQPRATLEEVGLADVADDLGRRGLLAPNGREPKH